MDAFWISAQISMTPSLCQLSLPSAPRLHPICLINWSEILAAKPYPGGSIGIYLPWIRNWDPEARTASTYSGTQEMQPEELFKGYILIACAKSQWKDSLPRKGRCAEMQRERVRERCLDSLPQVVLWLISPKYCSLLPINFWLKIFLELAWVDFCNSQPNKTWASMA